jgi:hypothetical protein
VQSGRNEQRLTPCERDFEAFSRYCDVEILALEIEYSEDLRKGLREALDRRQAEFDRMMAVHPETVAERERTEWNRAEYEDRMARLREQDRVIPADVAARQLAKRWGLTLTG